MTVWWETLIKWVVGAVVVVIAVGALRNCVNGMSALNVCNRAMDEYGYYGAFDMQPACWDAYPDGPDY